MLAASGTEVTRARHRKRSRRRAREWSRLSGSFRDHKAKEGGLCDMVWVWANEVVSCVPAV
jgi:hypothetical protein